MAKRREEADENVDESSEEFELEYSFFPGVIVEPRRECSYLPSETASLMYRFDFDLDVATYERLLERGWRRFGEQLFRPACPTCRQCVPIRIDVEKFNPSKSQRRTYRKNEDVTVEIRPATVSDEHINLFNAYHRDMEARKGWPNKDSTWRDYYASFLQAEREFGFEFQYRRAGKLIGVGLVDVVPSGVSSVYFYHDPAWREDGPGTFSLMKEIEFAARTGRKYVYLGYWISQCPSMAYKATFRPHQLLREFVDDEQLPYWAEP